MFVFHFARLTARKTLWLGLAGLLTIACWAQDTTPAAAQSAPPPGDQSAVPPGAQSTMPPAGTQTPLPPLTPMPQAPAPQHNVRICIPDQNYAKPMSGFPNFIAPYTSRHVPQPNLTNSVHDGQAVSRRQDVSVDQRCGGHGDGKQSRHHAAALQPVDCRYRYAADQLRASARGVKPAWSRARQAVQSGAPSAGGTGSTATGASGTGAGGTQVGAGGAGAGAAGIVVSTLGFGPPIDNFDPVVDRHDTGSTCGDTSQSPIFLACRPSHKTPTPTTSAIPRVSPRAR